MRMSILLLSLTLFISGCHTSPPPPPPPPVFGKIDPCIADLITKSSYDTDVKRELSPKLSASIGTMGSGSIEFKKVSSDTIKMQVEKNSDPFAVQMALAVNIAECMDKKSEGYFATDDFKKLLEGERQKQRKAAYDLTTN